MKTSRIQRENVMVAGGGGLIIPALRYRSESGPMPLHWPSFHYKVRSEDVHWWLHTVQFHSELLSNGDYNREALLRRLKQACTEMLSQWCRLPETLQGGAWRSSSTNIRGALHIINNLDCWAEEGTAVSGLWDRWQHRQEPHKFSTNSLNIWPHPLKFAPSLVLTIALCFCKWQLTLSWDNSDVLTQGSVDVTVEHSMMTAFVFPAVPLYLSQPAQTTALHVEKETGMINRVMIDLTKSRSTPQCI